MIEGSVTEAGLQSNAGAHQGRPYKSGPSITGDRL
jgi:hypothetical protein